MYCASLMHAGFCLPGGNVSAPTSIECGIIIDWLAIKKHRQNLSYRTNWIKSEFRPSFAVKIVRSTLHCILSHADYGWAWADSHVRKDERQGERYRERNAANVRRSGNRDSIVVFGFVNGTVKIYSTPARHHHWPPGASSFETSMAASPETPAWSVHIYL